MTNQNQQLEVAIQEIFNELGITRKYRGYCPLMDMVKLYVENEQYQMNLSQYIYPVLCAKYGKSKNTIIRRIGYLLNQKWYHAPSYVQWNFLYGYGKLIDSYSITIGQFLDIMQWNLERDGVL